MSSEIVQVELEKYLNFKNGKSSPERDDSFSIPVYGSNGLIGFSEKSNAEPNSLIIGRVGSYCGSVYHSNTESWITDNAIIATPKNENESYFWYYLLLSSNLHNYRSGSGQPLLNQTTLNSISVSIPNDSERRIEIGEVLNTLDQKIHLNQQTNETLEAMAQAIFKSWFVDFDPVRAKIEATSAGRDPNRAAMAAIAGVSFELGWDENDAALEQKLNRMSADQRTQLEHTAELFPDELVESEIGEVPKGWDLGKLGDICSVQGGYAFKSKLFKEEGFPVVKIKNINEDYTVDLKNGEFLSEEDTIGKEIYELNDGDYVLAMTGATVGKTGIIVSNREKVMLNQRVAKFESDVIDGNINWFIHSAFLATNLKDQIVNNARGSAQPNISASGIESAEVIIPSERLIKGFINIADPLFKKWIDNCKQNETLASLRDTLLPNLISGKIFV